MDYEKVFSLDMIGKRYDIGLAYIEAYRFKTSTYKKDPLFEILKTKI